MKTPYLNNFRLSEIIQFCKTVAALCGKNNAEALHIKSQVDKLLEVSARLDEAYKRELKSKHTRQLIDLDQQRDNMIVGIRTIAEGFTYHFNQELIEAGQALLNCIDKYGARIYKMNYHAETSTLDNIYNDFMKSPALVKALELTNTRVMADNMKSVNTEFESVFENRLQDNAADNSESGGLLVKEAIADYRELAKHIEAHATIAPGESYTKLMKEIDELIDAYHATINMRQSAGEEKDIEMPDEAVNRN